MGKSYQKGWVVLRGQKWYGYFRKTVLDPGSDQEKTNIVPVILGSKSEMTKREAREALEREIAKLFGLFEWPQANARWFGVIWMVR